LNKIIVLSWIIFVLIFHFSFNINEIDSFTFKEFIFATIIKADSNLVKQNPNIFYLLKFVIADESYL
jgi:hypothetical protein